MQFHHPGSIKKSNEIYKQECLSINIILMDDYKGWNKKCTYKCLTCSYVFECQPSQLRTKANKGKACYNCWRSPILQEKRNKSFKQKADKKGLQVLKYPKTWDGKGKLYCKSCDFTFETNGQTLRVSKHCCPKFARNNFAATCKTKIYRLDKRKVNLHGYEPYAIAMLIESDYQSEDILTQESNKIPCINYTYEGKNKRHFPDLFIPKENLIIEVKSNATFGLNNQKLFELNKMRRKTAIQMGYNYKFIVLYQSGKYIYANPLFRGWSRLSFKEFNKKMKQTKHYVCVGTGYFS